MLTADFSHGAKADRLLEASRSVPVPPFFVVRHERLSAAFAADGAAERQLERLRAELSPQVRAVCPAGGSLAVRSSAACEDGARSFAGIFESVLDVPISDGLDELLAAIRQVWMSRKGPVVDAYLSAGVQFEVVMHVIVQSQLRPRVAGTLYSIDPVGRAPDTMIVEAVAGPSHGYAQGLADPQRFRLRAQDPAAGDNLRPGQRPLLDGSELSRLRALARSLEQTFGFAVDVEYAFHDEPDAGDRLSLLQVRPIPAFDGPSAWGGRG